MYNHIRRDARGRVPPWLIRVYTAAKQYCSEGFACGIFAIDRCLELILLELESAFRKGRPVQS